MRDHFLAVCLLLLCSGAFAQYRCVEDGKFRAPHSGLQAS